MLRRSDQGFLLSLTFLTTFFISIYTLSRQDAQQLHSTSQSTIKLFKKPPLGTVKLQTDSGMTPVNKLPCKLNVVIRDRAPISTGIVPMNSLSVR